MPRRNSHITLFHLTFSLLIWGWVQILSAQHYLPEPTLFTSTKFDRINFIEQDKRGFVWLSTDRGLFCFDGTFFRRIDHPSTNGLSAINNAQVNAMFLDQEQRHLWLATVKGATRFDLESETFKEFTFYQIDPSGSIDGECSTITKDRAGNIWFALKDLGLAKFDSTFQYYPAENDQIGAKNVLAPTINQVAQDVTRDSIFWLACGPPGLVKFNANTGVYTIPDQQVLERPGIAVILTNIYPTGDKLFLGSVWRNEGFVYDLQECSLKKLESNNPNFPNTDIKLGCSQPFTQNTILGLNENGPFLFDIREDSLLYNFSRPESVTYIEDFSQAQPNGIWAASDKGLLLYDMASYKVENHIIRKEAPNKPNFLKAVLEQDSTTRLWLAFQHSDFVYEYDRASRQLKSLAPPRGQDESPSHLIRLQDGQVLAISRKDGLFEIHKNQLFHLPLLENLLSTEVGIKMPYQDSKGNLWLGSNWGGFYRVDLKNNRYTNLLNNHDFKGCPNLFVDEMDNVWAGCREYSGLVLYHAKKDTLIQFPFQPHSTSTIEYPRGFAQDLDGYVWISDLRVGGLMKIDPNHPQQGILERRVATQGRYSNYMMSLNCDAKGRLWAVTEDGLQVFDPRDGTFRLFGESVGFRLRGKVRAMPNLIPSYLTKLSTDEMLVGYRDGFAVFHPDSLLAIQEQPRPYLLSVKVNDKKVKGLTMDQAPNIRLRHFENILEFEFSAINWHSGQKSEFMYRMSGLGKEWIKTAQRIVRYGQLSPGHYTFKLAALNNQGEQFQMPFSVHLQIMPPWWRTWWAYLIYLSLLLIAGYTFFQYKRKQWHLKAQLESEQREATRLKELDTFKTRLYTNITHEFRTPLTIILGLANQLGRSELKTTKNKWQEGLNLIKRNGQNLLRLVNQMLDLSKLEAGALPINLVQDDIIVFLKYLLESFHSLTKEKEINLDFKSRTSHLLMDFDPEKIREVVTNLVSNAIKFTPNGGEITMSAEVSKAQQSEQLILTVANTGPGIPDEKLPHIFERFYQVDDSATRSSEGTGIGLAVTKELITLLGGEISVESQRGIGTTFKVILPVKREVPPQLNPEVENAGTASTGQQDVTNALSTRKGERPLLLLVEDNKDVLLYLQSILSEYYSLEEAHNGEEGIEKAIKVIPDLIISDAMMPKVDGFELCKTLKNDFRTSHIPIVLLTAKADISSKIAGLERGADSYLTKPFHEKELLVRLQKLIASRKKLQDRFRRLTSASNGNPGIQLEIAFLQKVDNILEAHLSDSNFGVHELCIELGMSRSQLYRKIKALTDEPIGHRFRSLRLNRAMELLLTTNLFISEIAYQVGFKDPAYFTNAFKEEFGMSPRQMRKG